MPKLSKHSRVHVLKGAPVSSAAINARARGAVMAEDRCLLTESGSHLAFSDQKTRKTLTR